MRLLEDKIKRLFIEFLIPSIGGAVVLALYSFVDMIAIGQGVGVNGTAATAILTPIVSMASFLGLLVGMGGSVLYSRAKGEGDTAEANGAFTASTVFIGGIIVVVWISVLIFKFPIYRLLGGTEALIPYIDDYANLTFWTYPFFILLPFLSCFLRNDDAPKLVMISTLAGAAINIFFDWFFVFPCNMGMFGASLATSMGTAMQCFIMLTHFFTKKCTLKLIAPKKIISVIIKITKNGFGAGFSQLALIITTFITNKQIMKYAGDTGLAVFGIMLVLSQLFVGIFTGIGQAVQPIATTNFGADFKDRCKEVFGLGTLTTLICAVLFTGVCELFPIQVTKLFVDATSEVLEATPLITRIYGFSFLGMGIAVYISMYLQSVMEAQKATIISLTRGIVAPAILLYTLPLLFNVVGVWIAIVAAEAAAAVIAVVYTKINFQRN